MFKMEGKVCERKQIKSREPKRKR